MCTSAWTTEHASINPSGIVDQSLNKLNASWLYVRTWWPSWLWLGTVLPPRETRAS
jgi:hypothetical protein